MTAKHYLISILAAAISMAASAQTIQDLWSDTWVGTDALGRTMPTNAEVGDLKSDKPRTVGMFYVTWHTAGAHSGKPFTADVTKVLAEDDNARFDGKNPAWKDSFLHWGEPEYGYFISRDEYVIRHDLSMLADAGVDVIILDVTNASFYWEEWDAIFKTMHRMKAEGNKVPQFCFWAFNVDVITVVQTLYEKFYKNNEYRDLWFYWDGKPLLLYNSEPSMDSIGGGARNVNHNYDPDAAVNPANPHYLDPDYCMKEYTDYTREVKEFFTLRNFWWGYDKWNGHKYAGTEDNWSFGYELNDEKVLAMIPEQRAAYHGGKIEQMAVTPAQHAHTIVGKSWHNGKEPELGKADMPGKAYVPWLGKEVENPTAYGIYFQDRWEEALSADPSFLYLNDWNEWSAGKCPVEQFSLNSFMGRPSDFVFIDQYNAEFNRTIAPAKDKLYTDNYYMQMAENIRRYKGARPIPENAGLNDFAADGDFGKWKGIEITYFDTKGDTFHRDEDGYGDLHYTNTTGRNDIVRSKVAVGRDNISFYAETAEALTAWSDPNWMLLFIDVDKDSSTGWCGYDLVVNKSVKSGSRTSVMKYNARSGKWQAVGTASFSTAENKLEICVPRKVLGLAGAKDSIVFDFKWCDNPQSLEDAISLCTDGDAAPNRRFNYRMIWKR
ncbi:MAG: hypothetical protein MJY86_06440 [Bacteroidales bacterium]|nr:hypothetical protein [Bacteroidales bacterium]